MIDWKYERDRVDLVRVATDLLGEAPGRRGNRGGYWWNCPFHSDHNPSFQVDPGKARWRCYGCGEHGDAANLVVRLRGKTFPEAVASLTGGSIGLDGYRPPPPPKSVPPVRTGLPHAEALALVAEAEGRLWSPEGAEALAYLTSERFLDEETIRTARLGWTPGTRLLTKDGRPWSARGVIVPWFDQGRLALVKIRQPEGVEPRYAEAFRDRPVLLFGAAGEAGQPLVVVEGEFDALLVGQALRGRATVVTHGSASGRPEATTLADLVEFSPWLIATDADQAGDQTAAAWPKKAHRVRPPGASKDWTEAAQGGVDLARWWGDRLAGIEEPELFAWDELRTWRWGDAASEDGEDGLSDVIEIPVDHWRWTVARWPMDRWQDWHQRVGELEAEAVRPGDDEAERAEGIRRAERRAYEELMALVMEYPA